MKTRIEFEFENEQEMISFTARLSQLGSAANSAPLQESAPAVTSASASATAPKPAPKKAAKPAAAPVVAEAQADNPFAGMPTGSTAQAEQPAPAQTQPGFDRQAILDKATGFIGKAQDQGLHISKIAELMNNLYFIPRGLPQCPARELNDFQLQDFFNELVKSIAPAAEKEIAALKSKSSLV